MPASPPCGASRQLSRSLRSQPRAGPAPALGLAVHQIAQRDPDALIVSVHADHHVGDPEAYRAAVLAVAGWAEATQGLATVGLTPTFPSTGLGYIAMGPPEPPERWAAPPGPAVDAVLLAAAAALPAAHAAAFVEKPPAELATKFVEDGNHLWNLGLFAWTASAFLDELRAADPDLDAALREVVQARSADDEPRAARIYSSLRAVAVDPLVMEHSSRLTVVRAGFGWSDLGSWADLLGARAAAADSAGNVAVGDALFVDSRDCLVEAGGGRVVAVLGLDGVVVVDTGDALLVMAAEASQDVKLIVERLRREGRDELL